MTVDQCRLARVGFALLATAFAGCGSDGENPGANNTGGSADAGGVGGVGGIDPGGAGGSAASSAGGLGGLSGMGGAGAGSGSGGSAGFVACTGTSSETEAVGALDMYLIFDRTASMGQDCDYAGGSPPVNSKACFATYALSQYFMSQATAGHRLAFEFMSVPDGVCAGGPNNGEASPLIDMTALPVNQNHALVQAISNETFAGGLGTQIEAALRGIATYTANNVTPGRTMIGILMTDGDPNGCDNNIDNLARIVRAHHNATNIKTFIIGMNGATLANLERYAAPGGAQPHTDFCGNGPSPCHYWDVGNGDPAAIISALNAIANQGIVPCVYAIPTTTSTGEAINFGLVNVQYRDANANAVTVGRVTGAAQCGPQGGWYYNTDPNVSAPTAIHLCPTTCELAKTAGTAAGVNVVFGCQTQIGPPA
jgi:hypothetical protein